MNPYTMYKCAAEKDNQFYSNRLARDVGMGIATGVTARTLKDIADPLVKKRDKRGLALAGLAGLAGLARFGYEARGIYDAYKQYATRPEKTASALGDRDTLANALALQNIQRSRLKDDLEAYGFTDRSAAEKYRAEKKKSNRAALQGVGLGIVSPIAGGLIAGLHPTRLRDNIATGAFLGGMAGALGLLGKSMYHRSKMHDIYDEAYLDSLGPAKTASALETFVATIR